MKVAGLAPRLLLALAFLVTARPPHVAPAQTARTQAAPGVVRVQGLKKGVTVRRDERGRPYIEAADEEDLYFAQGYVTASDRLWQMDLLRRTARGELSEIFGQSTLEEDKRRRTYGFAQVAEAVAAQADPRSPHWQDQIEDWRNATPRVFPFTRAAVTRAARETLTLAPK